MSRNTPRTGGKFIASTRSGFRAKPATEVFTQEAAMFKPVAPPMFVTRNRVGPAPIIIDNPANDRKEKTDLESVEEWWAKVLKK